MYYLKFIITLLTCCTILFSQSGITSKTGTVAAIPATCTIGEWYWANNATPGANLYFCTSSNTWTVSGGVGGVTSLAATSPFAVSASTGAVTGSLLVNVDYGFTAAQTITRAAIGGTSTDALILTNTTAASAGVQQWSPRTRWTGQGWKTDATAASQPVDLWFNLKPIQGAANPDGVLVLTGRINGGSATDAWQWGMSTQSTTYAAMWPGNVTPGSANWFLSCNVSGADCYINATTNLVSRINGSAVQTLGGSTISSFGAYTLSILGKVTQYNSITTVSNGVPSELATIDLTAQTAAKGSTLLYTPTATGWYRVQYVAKVTTAASVSSILGGTTGFTLSYQDGTDSVAVTMTCPEFNEAGANLAIGTGNTGNATTSMVQGTCQIYAKTGVAINYTFGYSSTNAAEMVYHLRGKLEAM